jgi:hypothetical protein
MKKIIFCLLFIPNIVNAYDGVLTSEKENHYIYNNFDLKWNIGNIGIGYNFFKEGGNFEQFFDLLNIGIEHKNTRVGLEYNLVKYWPWTSNDGDSSFLNINVYWNIFYKDISNDTAKLYFGPFNSVNYINGLIYTAGFRMGIVLNDSENILYNFLGTEIGYRNYSGKNIIYVGFKVDMMVIPFLFHFFEK